jgi:hypothetical protein
VHAATLLFKLHGVCGRTKTYGDHNQASRVTTKSMICDMRGRSSSAHDNDDGDDDDFQSIDRAQSNTRATRKSSRSSRSQRNIGGDEPCDDEVLLQLVLQQSIETASQESELRDSQYSQDSQDSPVDAAPSQTVGVAPTQTYDKVQRAASEQRKVSSTCCRPTDSIYREDAGNLAPKSDKNHKSEHASGERALDRSAQVAGPPRKSKLKLKGAPAEAASVNAASSQLGSGSTEAARPASATPHLSSEITGVASVGEDGNAARPPTPPASPIEPPKPRSFAGNIPTKRYAWEPTGGTKSKQQQQPRPHGIAVDVPKLSKAVGDAMPVRMVLSSESDLEWLRSL